MAQHHNKSPLRVYLCDLTHVSQIVASEIFPLNVGYVGMYSKKVFGEQIDLKLFKYPQDIVAALESQMPDVIGFSNYLWNIDLSYSFAERIKRAHPDCAIVFGGPNYPSVAEEQEVWLREKPAIDLFVYKEGEIPFAAVIEQKLRGVSLPDIQRMRFPGIHAFTEGRFFAGVPADRIKDLDLIPSPYLEGYFDPFFDGKLMCMLQTTRGCPFSCAFCVEGLPYYNKIYRFSEDRIIRELEYMAIHRKGNGNLFIADSNFGMYREDITTARAIAKTHEAYGFPEYIYATTGKNETTRILECAEVLKDLLRVSATVQSLDAGVLKAVKRNNISPTKLVQIADAAKHSNSNTYADVILALPEDSVAAHFGTIKGLVEAGVDYLTLFTTILLDSTEIATLESRCRYKMVTRFRVLPRCFGSYQYEGEEFISAETEEVCVGNATLSFEDYLECRVFDLTVGVFYNDRIFCEVNALLQHLGISVFDWLLAIHEQRHRFPGPLKAVYAQFLKETQGELWEARDILLAAIKSSQETLKEYICGQRGNNVFYSARAAVLVDCVRELHDVAYAALGTAMQKNGHAVSGALEGYLTELRRYSELRKINPLSLTEKKWRSSFHYDFLELEKNGFQVFPARRLDEPMEIEFVQTEDQKKLLAAQLNAYGTTRIGLARLIGKNPVKKFYRTPRLAKTSLDHLC
ncbi:MAG: B12-binding domain-containing radical SAM protein [Candidatus Omnitrophota bacterium]